MLSVTTATKEFAMPSKIDCIFPFGTYKGQYVSDIYEVNPSYLDWVLGNCEISDEVRNAIEYHLN